MTLREIGEYLGLMLMAIIMAVFGLAVTVFAIAAPFAAVGLGIAVAIKVFAWALGWPI